MRPSEKRTRIRALIDKLGEGNAVSKRDLLGAIGADGVQEFEKMWEFEKDRRGMLGPKPSELSEYERLLRRGDFFTARAEALVGRKLGPRSKKDGFGRNSRTRLYNAAETAYEAAVERLEELVQANPNLVNWFDREIGFDAERTPSLDSMGMPRCITSRSIYKKTENVAGNRTKAQVKRDVLNGLLRNLEDNSGNEQREDAANAERLKKMLAGLKRGK